MVYRLSIRPKLLAHVDTIQIAAVQLADAIGTMREWLELAQADAETRGNRLDHTAATVARLEVKSHLDLALFDHRRELDEMKRRFDDLEAKVEEVSENTSHDAAGLRRDLDSIMYRSSPGCP